MKNIILIVPIFVIGLFSFSCTTHTSNSSGSGSGAVSWSQAVYCNVEELSVCAVAQSESDCKKLGGEKIKVCP